MGFFPRTQVGATKRIFSQAKSWNSSQGYYSPNKTIAKPEDVQDEHVFEASRWRELDRTYWN